MIPRVFQDDGREVALSKRDFVARGGEGSVYAQGGVAYKLYHDPQRALTPARLAALSALDHPRVLRPEGLLRDDAGAPIGFHARFIPSTWPLCRLFARSFRDRHQIDHDALFSLLLGMLEVVDHAHERAIQIVDLNPLNVLVGPDRRTAYFIDVDSWQAPGFPATAIMDSVRDRHAPPDTFDDATDWFAFAVVAFQLLVGVHPYRGGHPVVGLDARMAQNISALRPDVVLPPSATPPSLLPAELRSWFHAVLEDGERRPPDRLALVSRFAPAPASPPRRAGFEAQVEAGRLRVVAIATGVEVPITLAATAFSWHDGRLYALAGDAIVEVTLRTLGGRTFATTRVASQVLPLATALYPGVALQDALGAVYASLFTGPGVCHQLQLPPLDGLRVADASYAERTLTVLVGRPDGRFDRLVFSFDRSFRAFTVAVAADVEPSP
ncbi:MAG: hypothetical protein CVU56_14910 [Deltaproteobacteria bacterium HGW-Deltaproteobacteria-14]|jgi:hypothetical protein|nr:MAG: hypothetical protein CVU56_14910 [Deltaproteobacteria bacterium HGW-Deltaproteobacteria-14]